MPTYSVCFEEMLVSGFDFSFFEGSEAIVDAADWLAVDSTGNLNITPTCTEFVKYLYQGTLIVKIVATSKTNPSVFNEEVTV